MDVKKFVRTVITQDICIMECLDAVTKKPVQVVCTVSKNPDRTAKITPLARLVAVDELLPVSEAL